MQISTNEKAIREIQKNCHDGKGEIVFREIFGKSVFKSKLSFFHETVIKPNSTIGNHLHTDNEEIYYVLEGEGVMIIDDERVKVKPGDATIVHGGSSHGLENNTSKNLKIIVFECSY